MSKQPRFPKIAYLWIIPIFAILVLSVIGFTISVYSLFNSVEAQESYNRVITEYKLSKRVTVIEFVPTNSKLDYCVYVMKEVNPPSGGLFCHDNDHF